MRGEKEGMPGKNEIKAWVKTNIYLNEGELQHIRKQPKQNI